MFVFVRGRRAKNVFSSIQKTKEPFEMDTLIQNTPSTILEFLSEWEIHLVDDLCRYTGVEVNPRYDR